MARPKGDLELVKFMFTLPAEQLEWVKSAAMYRRKSASEILRRAIEFYSVNMPEEEMKEMQLGFDSFMKGARRPGSDPGKPGPKVAK
jgi:hypothetical protein